MLRASASAQSPARSLIIVSLRVSLMFSYVALAWAMTKLSMIIQVMMTKILKAMKNRALSVPAGTNMELSKIVKSPIARKKVLMKLATIRLDEGNVPPMSSF